MKIIKASLNQYQALASLFDSYRIYYRQKSDIALANQFIHDRLIQQDSTIFIAIDYQKVIGFVQLYPIFSSVNANKSLLLNDLFVASSACRKGTGRALIQYSF